MAKSKLEQEMDEVEKIVSKDWAALDAMFNESLEKVVRHDFPEEAEELLRQKKRPSQSSKTDPRK